MHGHPHPRVGLEKERIISAAATALLLSAVAGSGIGVPTLVVGGAYYLLDDVRFPGGQLVFKGLVSGAAFMWLVGGGGLATFLIGAGLGCVASYLADVLRTAV